MEGLCPFLILPQPSYSPIIKRLVWYTCIASFARSSDYILSLRIKQKCQTSLSVWNGYTHLHTPFWPVATLTRCYSLTTRSLIWYYTAKSYHRRQSSFVSTSHTVWEDFVRLGNSLEHGVRLQLIRTVLLRMPFPRQLNVAVDSLEHYNIIVIIIHHLVTTALSRLPHTSRFAAATQQAAGLLPDRPARRRGHVQCSGWQIFQSY